MSLDILNPVHLKRISGTGTIGIIRYQNYRKRQHHPVNPNYWGVYDDTNEYYEELASNGTIVNDPCGTFIGDDFYTYGGDTNGSTFTNQFAKYNVVSGAWDNLLNAPSARKESCMVDYNGDIYVYGGYTSLGNATNNTMIYRASDTTPSWSNLTTTNNPPAKARHDCCVLDGYMYTYGGWNNEGNNSSITDSLYRLNLSTLSWEQITSSGYPMINSVILPYNGKIYVFGGYNTVSGATYNRPTERILIYDPSLNIWTEGNYCPYPGGEDDGYVYDNKAYLFDTVVLEGVKRNSIQVYDFVEDVWTYRLSGGRSHGESAIGGHPTTGDMYIFGGVSESGRCNFLDKWTNNDYTMAIRKV